MLEVEGLSKRWPGGAALFEGIDLAVGAGEIVAILGESGAGKSTFLNCIAGLDRPDAGRVRVAGRELTALGEDELARWRRVHLGFVFQQFHLLPYLDVAANVALPLLLAGVPTAERHRRSLAQLDRLGIADLAARRPASLSGGEMQRVAVARAVVHGPALVLADEPTGNLDEAHARTALALLRDAVKAAGAAALVVTHSRLAAGAADRVLRLAGRRLAPDPA